MTVIAVMTMPISVLAALIGLYCTGNTINVMTLAGLTLAIGPLVDSAIICLENTHRHLGLGATPAGGGVPRGQRGGHARAGRDPLHASWCSRPLALMPGLGEFLFRPMALAVAFAMIAAYILSRTFVPACSAAWLKPHAATARTARRRPTRRPTAATSGRAAAAGSARAFARWEAADRRGHSRAYVAAARRRPAAPPAGRSASAFGAAGRRSLGCSGRSSAASSSPRSTPAPSRSTSGPRAAPGSRRPRRRIAQVEEFVREDDRRARPAS